MDSVIHKGFCGLSLVGSRLRFVFDYDVAELDADAALAAAASLRAVADRAEAKLLEVVAHFADLHPVPAGVLPDSVIVPGMEDTEVHGGEGCPTVAEFAPAELGAVLGMSTTAATGLLSDVLGLRHRLPRTWGRVLAGEVPAWRARRVAQASRKLSRSAAAAVDAHVAPIAERVTPYRLERIVDAAVMDSDLDRARAEADAVAAGRGVWVTQSDPLGTKTVVVKAAAGDAIRFDARVAQIADALARLGDTDTKDVRRAKAIGWLADPEAAVGLLAGSEDAPAASVPAPRHVIHVHLTDAVLAGGEGVIRADDCGPMLLSQLSELLGHDKVVVRPVIDLADRLSVDAYEIPLRIRERVLLRDTHCVFPWCNRPATRRTDLDHIVPYNDTGPPGQTSTENLAPLCRLHHRLKTHGRWRCRRLPDGTIEWMSPSGRVYFVDHAGTHADSDSGAEVGVVSDAEAAGVADVALPSAA